MNNNENNNNNGNNNDLNVISLGGVENTDVSNLPINEMPAVSQNPEPTLNGEENNTDTNNSNNGNNNPTNDINQIPTMEAAPVAPMAEMPTPPDPVLNDGGEIPQVPTIPDINQVPNGQSYDVPEVMNNMNVTPFLNEIGTVPPIPNVPTTSTGLINDDVIPDSSPNNSKEVIVPKKKNKSGNGKGMNKILFVIIIVLALAAVGVGVYILLGVARERELSKKPSVTLKEVLIELGSNPSSDINDYAEFKNYDSSTCTLDATGIKDTTSLGVEYEFTVTCPDQNLKGKARIVDTVAPKITTKEATVMMNGSILPDEFVSSCEDASKCSYEFKDEKVVNESLKTLGEYDIVIVAKDAAGNKTEATAKMIVSEVVASLYLNCEKNVEDEGYIELLKLGLSSNNEFIKVGIKEITFTLSEEDYTALKSEHGNKDTITYNDITGVPTFDDTDYSLKITQTLTYEDLTTEGNGEPPLTYAELKAFYENQDYACSIGF